MPQPPTKEQLQYFDMCLIRLQRYDVGFQCVVKENPLSSKIRSFTDWYSFGAMQKAMTWLWANRRK